MIDRIAGHTFLSRGRLSVVVDLGVNRGRFTDTVAANYGATVHGIEALSELAEARGCEWAAIAGHTGHIDLVRPACGDASVAIKIDGEVEEVPALTLTDFFARHNITKVDLMKVDIEGAELEMIEGDPAPLLACEQIAIEYHDFLDPASATRVSDARARMRRLGFTEIRFSGDNTDILYLRSRPPFYLRLWLILRYRYAAGVIRRLAAKLS